MEGTNRRPAKLTRKPGDHATTSSSPRLRKPDPSSICSSWAPSKLLPCPQSLFPPSPSPNKLHLVPFKLTWGDGSFNPSVSSPRSRFDVPKRLRPLARSPTARPQTAKISLGTHTLGRRRWSGRPQLPSLASVGPYLWRSIYRPRLARWLP